MRFASLALLLTAAAGAAAQSPEERPRSGAYVDISPSYGSIQLTTAGCTGTDCIASQSVSGLAWSLAIGGTIDPNWRIGLQVDTHTSSFGAATNSVVSFYTAAGTWYPFEDGSLWIRANVGLGQVRLNGITSSSASVGGGIGYDWFPFHSDLAVMPWVSYIAQISPGSLGGQAGTAQATIWQIGLAVGLRH
ncbi:MAG TPA: hypothetical protein VMT93_11060 [Gemmatimonadaceae bacterium]|nr:hypothetical protein [Gemmatimonadaceae bacterium]